MPSAGHRLPQSDVHFLGLNCILLRSNYVSTDSMLYHFGTISDRFRTGRFQGDFKGIHTRLTHDWHKIHSVSWNVVKRSKTQLSPSKYFPGMDIGLRQKSDVDLWKSDVDFSILVFCDSRTPMNWFWALGDGSTTQLLDDAKYQNIVRESHESLINKGTGRYPNALH